jgi:4-diphosphocytidyl-2-C-methyl-D-erythritol kinase
MFWRPSRGTGNAWRCLCLVQILRYADSMRRSLTSLAPAKLNLALSVGPPSASEGPSAKGMHPICSWMVTVDLFDELLLTRLEPGRMSRYAILWHADAKRRSDINWSISKDLAVRAHLALEKRTGRALPLQLKMEKRIPVGGGLGGGSSDAAAMLRGVNDLFELRLPVDQLAAIGATIGSDVPFLVHGGSAIVQGVGDQIARLDHGGKNIIHAVIAFPDAACPTAQVYNLFDQHSANGASNAQLRAAAVAELTRTKPSAMSHRLFNDLAGPAIMAAPSLKGHLDDLSRLAERPAHITGSGSSIFVICDDEMHAGALAEAVQHKLDLPAVAVKTCTIPNGDTQ